MTMRIFLASILLVLMGCARRVPKAVATSRRPPLPARPLATRPPLDFVLIPVPNKPIVSFRLVFHTGSVDDPKGKEGLTALTARLMTEGGTQSLSSSQLLQVLFPMAAELSVHTDKEFTTWVGRVHRDHLQPFLKILTDVLIHPRFDPNEFERLRADALNVIRNDLRNQDEESLGKVALDALLYPDHPYRHFVGGTVQGLTAVTLAEVKSHAQAVFSQDRLVVGLGGAADSDLADKVKSQLAPLNAVGRAQSVLPPASLVRGKTVIIQKPSLSTAISMGYAYALRRGDPDFYPLAFASSYLGEHRQFHGVLFRELRERRGLNYGDYAYAEHFRQEGESTLATTNVARSQQDFSIWLRPVEPGNALFATRGALYFFDKLVHAGIDPERFEQVRGFLIGYTRLWEQTDEQRLGHAIDELFYKTPDYLENYRKALAALTPEQVTAAIKGHLRPADLNYVFVASNAKALRQLLVEQAPSTIAYPTPKAPEVLELDKLISEFHLPLRPEDISIIDTQSFMER